MPAINFQKQFASMVESGTKRQTIRAMRKRPFKVGDILYLYSGMRTKQCRKIGETKCNIVRDIIIKKDGDLKIFGMDKFDDAWKEMIAGMDGFKNWNELVEWFSKTHGLPFEGQIIRW